ncbi:MAG TPA: hypothetical protein PK536_13360 [Ignavibacteria bacterium]|nr:hypothetical protein [Ignavibacteria bacterium]HRJ99532.1 hypothetical protein [Ignavibacteria bacterium]
MNRLNLISIFKTFSRTDLYEFDKFIRSPYYNNQSTLVRLFRQIKKYYPEFNNKNFTKIKLFSSVNPGKQFNSLLFRKYISNLTKLAEKFIFTENFSKNKMKSNLVLLEYFENTGLNNLFLKKDKEISDLRFKKEKISIDYPVNKLTHNEINFNFIMRIPGIGNQFSSKSLNLILENNLYVYMNFLHFFANNLRKLYMHKFYFDISDMSLIIKELFRFIKLKDLENLEKQCSGNDKLYLKLIKYDIMMSTENFNDFDLRNMRKTVFESDEILNHNLLYYYLARMNTFCSAKYSSANEFYKRVLFENYKYMVEKGLFFTDGTRKINFSEYHGIIFFALKAKEFDWAENFIAKCKKLGSVSDSENIELYSLALLNFYKGEFEKCLNYSSRVNMKKFFLRFGLSKITIKAMYELNFIDMADKYAKNYKRFINTQTGISEKFRDNELKFLEYFNLLIHKKINHKQYIPKSFISKLNSEFEQKSNQWIIEKFNLLLKTD